jgi:TM2 domain-containing membrane protein YozV
VEQFRKNIRILLRNPLLEVCMDKPGIAAVLSFLIPGVGQLYNGKILRAIFWFIITPGLWIGTGGLLGWLCHVIAACTAYSYAKEQTRFPITS